VALENEDQAKRRYGQMTKPGKHTSCTINELQRSTPWDNAAQKTFERKRIGVDKNNAFPLPSVHE
jgi:hypothetical protein